MQFKYTDSVDSGCKKDVSPLDPYFVMKTKNQFHYGLKPRIQARICSFRFEGIVSGVNPQI